MGLEGYPPVRRHRPPHEPLIGEDILSGDPASWSDSLITVSLATQRDTGCSDLLPQPVIEERAFRGRGGDMKSSSSGTWHSRALTRAWTFDAELCLHINAALASSSRSGCPSTRVIDDSDGDNTTRIGTPPGQHPRGVAARRRRSARLGTPSPRPSKILEEAKVRLSYSLEVQ